MVLNYIMLKEKKIQIVEVRCKCNAIILTGYWSIKTCDNCKVQCYAMPRAVIFGQGMEIGDPRVKRQTLKDWCIEKHIIILDPDGFDRKDPKLFERDFTEQEFETGCMRSTVISKIKYPREKPKP